METVRTPRLPNQGQMRGARRRVRCPNCGWRLCDTFAAGKMETCELRDGVAPPWIPDYVTKCARCKREIGIHKEV